MITIRNYTKHDSLIVGCLIADTYGEFNLSFASTKNRARMLGAFHYARSSQPEHLQAIADILQSPIFLVAEKEGQVVGALRGREERIASLFVRKDHHRQGIGRRLVKAFEAEMTTQGISVIRVAATIYAVPFYTRLGYKKSTGVRTSWSFDGYGLPIQPMKKLLPEP